MNCDIKTWILRCNRQYMGGIRASEFDVLYIRYNKVFIMHKEE